MRPELIHLTQMGAIRVCILFHLLLSGIRATAADDFLTALQRRDWHAASRLANRADDAATDRSRLIDGFRLCLSGAYAEAQRTFHTLLQSDDSLTRALAIEADGQLLLLAGEWNALADLPATPGADTSGQAAERAFYRFFGRHERQTVRFDRDSSTVPMPLRVSENPTLEAVINGRKARACWDTGAGICILSSSLASKLQVRTDGDVTAPVSSASAKQLRMQAGIIDSIRIGAITWRNVPCGILDDRLLEFRVAGIRVAGFKAILGWPLMQSVDMTLDFAAERLTLRRPQPATQPRNLSWYGIPQVTTMLEGCQDTLLFQIDFGGYPTQAFAAMIGRIQDSSRIDSIETRIGGAGGFTNYRAATFSQVTLKAGGRSRAHTRLVERIESGNLNGVRPEGVFGVAFVEEHRVRMDFTNGVFMVE